MVRPARIAVTVTVALAGALGCAARPWPAPAGYKREVIPFPLDFAPALGHRGVEELRFPPGFLDARSPNHWSYAFAWRLDDTAALDATALGGELAVYFRGLAVAVDGDRHRFDPAQITASAERDGDHFAVRAHLFDAFGTAAPVDLVGTARRVACGKGALWTFVLAPEGSPLRAELAAHAECGQPASH